MKSGIRVVFLRDKNRNPVGCVAMQVSKNKKAIRYQLSTCNPIDKFDRALARQLALGRLLDKPLTLKSALPLKSLHNVTAMVMEKLALDSSTPNRSQKAALRWLT